MGQMVGGATGFWLLRGKHGTPARWRNVSDAIEIDRRVEGTELAAMISKEAPDQRNGVLASLGLIADGLRLLKTREQAGGREWSATEWAEKREGWIFLTSTEDAEQEALRPPAFALD
jgi:hypothetical protein